MTCNKNAQQQDAKNNTELQTKWMKKTWQTCEKTFTGGRNRPVMA